MANEIETTFEGYLGADAAVELSNSGKEVANLSVAVGIRRKNADGAWEDVRTDWVRVSCWDRLVGSVVQLTKGTRVRVVGRLTPAAYMTKQEPRGPRVDLRVTASSVTVVPRPPQEARTAPAPEQWAASPEPAGAPF